MSSEIEHAKNNIFNTSRRAFELQELKGKEGLRFGIKATRAILIFLQYYGNEQQVSGIVRKAADKARKSISR